MESLLDILYSQEYHKIRKGKKHTFNLAESFARENSGG